MALWIPFKGFSERHILLHGIGWEVLRANLTGLQFLGKSSSVYSFVVPHKFIWSWSVLFLDLWGYNGRCEAIKAPSSWCKINSYPSIKEIWWIFRFDSLPNGKSQLYTHSHHAPSCMACATPSDCWQRTKPTVTTVPRSYVSRCTFRTCPSFSSMTSFTFYDLLSLTHVYNFHMLTISHVNDFTCLRFHMLTVFTCFSFTYFVRLPCTI